MQAEGEALPLSLLTALSPIGIVSFIVLEGEGELFEFLLAFINILFFIYHAHILYYLPLQPESMVVITLTKMV